jgi:hypothetical protein
MEINNDIFAYIHEDQLSHINTNFSYNGRYSFDTFIYKNTGSNAQHFRESLLLSFLITD